MHTIRTPHEECSHGAAPSEPAAGRPFSRGVGPRRAGAPATREARRSDPRAPEGESGPPPGALISEGLRRAFGLPARVGEDRGLVLEVVGALFELPLQPAGELHRDPVRAGAHVLEDREEGGAHAGIELLLEVGIVMTLVDVEDDEGL